MARSSGFSRHSWVSLTLLIVLLAATWQRSLVSAKELEGFDEDEFEETVEDEVEEVVIPQRIPSRSVKIEPDQLLDSAGRSNQQTNVEGSQASPASPSSPSDPTNPPADPATSRRVSEPEWDDDEFEGGAPGGDPGSIPGGGGKGGATPQQQRRLQQQQQQQQQQARIPPTPVPRKPFKPQDFIAEICFLAFLLIYAVNFFIGKSKNEKLALAWANHFGGSASSLLQKNFALVGTGDVSEDSEATLVKEGQDTFKLYASGRRFCEAMLVTIRTRSRHDLATYAWDMVISSRRDLVDVEVFMNDDSMAPFVLAVVPRRAAKVFHRDHEDLKGLASVLDADVVLRGGNAKNKWAGDQLAIISDSREAANELLSDVIIEQLFGEKSFPQHASDLFVSFHFTDQHPVGPCKKVLRFTFAMTSNADRMGDMGRLMAAVPFFIDAVAKFNMSTGAKAKAEAARAKYLAEASREAKERRQEEMLKRREEKRKAEEAKLAPEELARRREKERLRNLKQSAPRARVARMH